MPGARTPGKEYTGPPGGVTPGQNVRGPVVNRPVSTPVANNNSNMGGPQGGAGAVNQRFSPPPNLAVMTSPMQVD